MQRQNQTAFLHNVEGERVAYPATLHPEESLFGQLGEPHGFPNCRNCANGCASGVFTTSLRLARIADPRAADRRAFAGAGPRRQQPRRRLGNDC